MALTEVPIELSSTPGIVDNSTGTAITIAASGNVDVTGSVTATSFETDAGGTFTTASGNDLNIVYPSARSLFIKEGSETHVTVDNAGNVGIGTNSPNYNLTSYKAGANANYLQVANGSTGVSSANGTLFGVDASGNGVVTVQGSFDYITSVAGVERMRINSSGNVGINETNPQFKLDVENVGGDAIRINAGADFSGLRLTSTAGEWSVRTASDALIFYDVTSASEVGRFDSSGNLLVGKNSAGFANTGHELRGGGSYAAFTRDGGTPVLVNRKSNDGTLVEYMKDGTTVGSIGTSGGDLTVNAQTVGVLQIGGASKYAWTGTLLYPTNDNTSDLGTSSFRFKDLYLSGGVYVGGTGAANKLDDYEEGTWTPVYEGSTTAGTGTYTRQSGVYVKVGDLVYASCTIGISAHTGSGSAVVTGLPFSALNNTGNYAGISVSFNNGHTTTSGYQIIGFVQVSSAEIKLYETGGTGQQNTLALDTAFTEFDFSIVYRAA